MLETLSPNMSIEDPVEAVEVVPVQVQEEDATVSKHLEEKGVETVESSKDGAEVGVNFTSKKPYHQNKKTNQFFL